MATDEEIGANLTRIRGSRSQKDLAEAMRERGFKWSQATVWSVEKGERPLRLTEAQALGVVLGINHDLLLSRPGELDLHAAALYSTNLLEDIRDLAYESYGLQKRLARAVDDRPAAERAGITLATILRTAVDAAAEGLASAEEHERASGDADAWIGSHHAGSHEFTEAFLGRVRSVVNADVLIHAQREGDGGDGVDQAES